MASYTAIRTLPPWGTVGHIADAVIEYCRSPIFFNAPQSAHVKNSSLRNFGGTGIEMQYAGSPLISGNIIAGNDSTRISASSDSTEIAFRGVYSYLSTPTIEDNTIGFHPSRGIAVEFSKSHCLGASTDSMSVERNILEGWGRDYSELGAGTGLWLFWACEPYHLLVGENEVRNWSGTGAFMWQCEDARWSCNVVEDNGAAGLYYQRGAFEVTTAPVRMYSNKLQRNRYANLWTDGFDRLLVHEASGFAGLNVFWPDSVRAGEQDGEHGLGEAWENILELQWGSGSLDATHQVWTNTAGVVWDDSDPGDQDAVRDSVAATFDLAYGTVSFFGFEDLDESCGAQSAKRERPMVAGVVDSHDAGGSLAMGSDGSPPDWELRALAELSGAVVFRLGAPDAVQWIGSLDIYNVQGQRVRSLDAVVGSAGWHRVYWDARDRTGRRVASGVYFGRLVVPDGRVLTQKISVIR